MNVSYLENVYDRIFYNAFYFWLYFFSVCLTGIYTMVLYFKIDILGVPATFNFVFMNFTDLNLYFNLGLILGFTLILFFFLGGMVSSINIYNKVKYIYYYDFKFARIHLINSFLAITLV